MTKLILSFASISGMLAVGLGAFGAHALKAKLETNGYLSTYQTAVQYHFYHTLALVLIGILMMKMPSSWLNYASSCMMIGMILFSGSLYTLSISGIKWLGAITPIGGLFFIAGWFFLLMAVIKTNF
jgi:uncharacterized membrane protein YgdD (TMEM256/DUF423 family)